MADYKNAAEAINSKEFGEFHKGLKEYKRGRREGHIEESDTSKQPLKPYQALAKAKAKKTGDDFKVEGIRVGTKNHKLLTEDRKHYRD